MSDLRMVGTEELMAWTNPASPVWEDDNWDDLVAAVDELLRREGLMEE